MEVKSLHDLYEKFLPALYKYYSKEEMPNFTYAFHNLIAHVEAETTSKYLRWKLNVYGMILNHSALEKVLSLTYTLNEDSKPDKFICNISKYWIRSDLPENGYNIQKWLYNPYVMNKEREDIEFRDLTLSVVEMMSTIVLVLEEEIRVDVIHLFDQIIKEN